MKQKKMNKITDAKNKVHINITKLMNRIGYLFPIVLVIICIGTIACLLFFPKSSDISSIADLAIASITLVMAVFSLLNGSKKESLLYICMIPLFTLSVAVMLIAAVFVGIKIHNPEITSRIGRIISAICLAFTLFIELLKTIKRDFKIDRAKEEQLQKSKSIEKGKSNR